MSPHLLLLVYFALIKRKLYRRGVASLQLRERLNVGAGEARQGSGALLDLASLMHFPVPKQLWVQKGLEKS